MSFLNRAAGCRACELFVRTLPVKDRRMGVASARRSLVKLMNVGLQLLFQEIWTFLDEERVSLG